MQTALQIDAPRTVPNNKMRVAILEDDISQTELLSHWLQLAELQAGFIVNYKKNI